MAEPMKCKCGGKPRLRHKKPFAWVECSSKKCSMKSGFVHDGYGLCDDETVKQAAITLWNAEVRKNGEQGK